MELNKIDFQDVDRLRSLNSQFEMEIMALNDFIDEDTKLKLVLLEEISSHEIRETLSFENKIVRLMSLVDDVKKGWVKDFFINSAEIKKTTNRKDQLLEAIKSLKKIIDVTPN